MLLISLSRSRTRSDGSRAHSSARAPAACHAGSLGHILLSAAHLAVVIVVVQ